MDQIQAKIVGEFAKLSTWEEKYHLIISSGKALEPLPENEKNEDLKIRGCQSQVWLKAELTADRKIVFRADSDALIVKGLIALLLRVYSGRSAAEILAVEPEFIKELGLAHHLSPSRANGLSAMVKQIKYYALAFQAL